MIKEHNSFEYNKIEAVKAVSSYLLKQAKPLSAAVMQKLKILKELLQQQDSKCWEIGDLCIQLLDDDRLSLRQISIFTDYSRTRISHFHLTSRTFTTNVRTGYTFQDSLTARQIHKKLPRLNMTPVEIRDEIVKMRNKTPIQVRSYFISLLTEMEKKQTLATSAQSYIYKDRLFNQCYHADWREIIPQLPDGSVQLFIADPPFPLSSGSLSKRTGTNALRTDCDHGSSDQESLAVTLPLFELCLPKLAPDGVLLLFQSGGKSDRVEVLQKAQEWGWECQYALTWNKGHLSMGNFQNPYLICSERILVFTGGELKSKKFQDGMPHSDVLDFATETPHVTCQMSAGKIKYGDYHMFQKPLALMEFLVQHHSFPGDLVVEPFGCSGSGVIAAAKLNRRWIYTESNNENYSWGSQRVSNSILQQSITAG